MHNYKYGLQQEGHFIPRALVTFEHFKGCFIVIRSKYGLSNYFGTSVDEGRFNGFTKSWAIKFDPENEDWKVLAEIFNRPVPEYSYRNLDVDSVYDKGIVQYFPNKQDIFYAERDKDIEAYITSKLGWQ